MARHLVSHLAATMACSFIDETDIDQGCEQNHGFGAANPVQQIGSGASARQAVRSSDHRSLQGAQDVRQTSPLAASDGAKAPHRSAKNHLLSGAFANGRLAQNGLPNFRVIGTQAECTKAYDPVTGITTRP